MDGTLVDSELNTGRAVDKLLTDEGIEHPGLDETLCYGKTWQLCVRELCKLYPQLQNTVPEAKAMERLQYDFEHGPEPPLIGRSVWAVSKAHAVIGKTAIATSSN